MSYVEKGCISTTTINALKNTLRNADWKEVKSEDRHFYTWFPDLNIDELNQFGEITTAFFLSIPPGGCVHKHVDTARPEKTYHVPVLTNDKAISYVLDKPYHLDVGKIYEIDRQIEHHSINEGDTSRIHLLIECI